MTAMRFYEIVIDGIELPAVEEAIASEYGRAWPGGASASSPGNYGGNCGVFILYVA